MILQIINIQMQSLLKIIKGWNWTQNEQQPRVSTIFPTPPPNFNNEEIEMYKQDDIRILHTCQLVRDKIQLSNQGT